MNDKIIITYNEDINNLTTKIDFLSENFNDIKTNNNF